MCRGELLQQKMQCLEDRLNQIATKQEFAIGQECAIAPTENTVTAEPLSQQSHAYAEHELGVQKVNDESTICVPEHIGMGILSHAAAACKTSFNAAVSICSKPKYLMSSNSIMSEFDCLSLPVFPMQASKDALLTPTPGPYHMNTHPLSTSGAPGANRPFIDLGTNSA